MFYLEKHFYDQMIAQALEEAPNECCGLLLGKDGRVLQFRGMTNSLHSPVRYNVEPKELLQVHKELDEKGWDIIGIYHSHTHSHAYPSATDIQLAFWPDSVYLIVSLEHPDHPRVRAFRIKDSQVAEEPVNIVKPWGDQ